MTPGRTGILVALAVHSTAVVLAWGLSQKTHGNADPLRLDFRLVAAGESSGGRPHLGQKVNASQGMTATGDTALPETESPPEGGQQASQGAQGQEAANTRYAQQNFNAVSGLVHANLYYPLEARRNGWEGTVVVNFWIYPDGTIHRIVLRQASGHLVLDESARDAIAALENLPRPATAVSLTIPVHFRMRK